MSETDLSRAVWYKSTYSNGQGGNCIEVASNLPGIVAVRDSKNPTSGALRLSRPAWRAFVAAVSSGQLALD